MRPARRVAGRFADEARLVELAGVSELSESTASRTIRPDRISSTLSSCGGSSASSSGRLRTSAATLRPITISCAATLPRGRNA